MKVTERTRRVLAARREDRDMTKAGFRRHETDWEIHRGYAAHEGQKILEARVSSCGMYVYTRIGVPEK